MILMPRPVVFVERFNDEQAGDQQQHQQHHRPRARLDRPQVRHLPWLDHLPQHTTTLPALYLTTMSCPFPFPLFALCLTTNECPVLVLSLSLLVLLLHCA
jgi:hypothetical protein